MKNLDDLNSIKKLDQGYSYESIAFLPEQCESAWIDVKKISCPAGYKKISSLLFCGMGGSAYGARIIKSLFQDQLKIPVDIISDYHLPAYVNKNVLIIAASYSGNTEETISCVKEALNLDAKIIGVTTGGELKDMLLRNIKPVWTIAPKYNPSMQPRLAQGYMQMGQIGILNRLGLINIDEKNIDDTIELLKLNNKILGTESPVSDNPAKKLAMELQGKIVNIIAGEFLSGAMHAIRNPFHETGKLFANYFVLPELNHHLMEGLSHPETNKDYLVFLLIKSSLYNQEIRKRLDLTKEVIEKNSIETRVINLSSKNKFQQVFELIQLGSFITFYLAMLHDIDPSFIPWVNYFKEKLKEVNYEK